MKLLNQFFTKKKYDVEDDELVWKRTDTNTGQNISYAQPVYNTDPANDMFMPKKFASNINPHPLETQNSYSNPKTLNRISRVSEVHQSQFNVNRQSLNGGQSLSPYKSDRYSNNNGAYENGSLGYGTPQPGQQGQHFNFTPNPPPNYSSHNDNNYGTGYQYTQYDSNTNPNTSYNDNYNGYMQQPTHNDFNSHTPFSRNGLRVRNVTAQVDHPNQYNLNHGNNIQTDRNVRPELRDYYNIEESIMKKMMTKDEAEQQPTVNKNVNVFGGRAQINPTKAVNHFREAVKRNPNPPINDRKLPTEVKMRKNLVFKAVDGETGETGVPQVELEPQQSYNIPEFESQYMGKSMEELQAILRERNARLTQLEEQNYQLVNNDTNLTFIGKQINELGRETDKLRDKNSHLETEQRLLYEELSSKKDQINELDVALGRMPSMDQPDTQAKKDLIERIAKNQQFIADIDRKLSSYEDGKNKEIEDTKKNSEKNMMMELEEIKINVMNYDEDLLKWMRFFEGKVVSGGGANVLDQSIF